MHAPPTHRPSPQFSFLPVPFEVYPAIGADQGVQLAQQGLQLGGTAYIDFVLVAPDFLHNRRCAACRQHVAALICVLQPPLGLSSTLPARPPHTHTACLPAACGPLAVANPLAPLPTPPCPPALLPTRSPSGLVSRLKMLGMRVCAYGWQPQGQQRELIESSGVDGFLMGPIHPQGIHRAQFVQLIAKMQALKRAPGGGMMAGGMGGGMMGGSMAGRMPSMAQPNHSMGGMAPAGSMYGAAAPRAAAPNPLYNAPQSPLASQPGAMGAPSPPHAAPPAGADGEAAMMQQLMSEINQLRAELGQN